MISEKYITCSHTWVISKYYMCNKRKRNGLLLLKSKRKFHWHEAVIPLPGQVAWALFRLFARLIGRFFWFCCLSTAFVVTVNIILVEAVVVVIVWYWIYNYLCNQCLSPLKLWVRIPFMARCTRYNIMW